ncbi:MAG: hypothetical protein HQL62_08485, partial [Magnetococcales bacterium]|nr:hypothetical protein [Magnetococcales bacterium]
MSGPLSRKGGEVVAPVGLPPQKTVPYLLIHMALLLPILCVYVGFNHANYPYVGSDFAYFLPRLLDSHIFYLKNGLHIQWWTPAFSGGLPAYPNPQQIQFSLPQVLLFWMDPWKAFNLAMVISVGMGYVGSYLFFRRIIPLSAPYATLGAVIFSANGFYLQHVGVGHVVYLGFPLLPLLALLLLERRWPVFPRAVGIALLAAYLIYGGGFYISVAMILSCFLIMITAHLLNESLPRSLVKTVQLLVMGGFFSLILTASKLSATYHLMRFFPRVWHESYAINGVHALLGFVAQLFYAPVALVWAFVMPRSVAMMVKESTLPMVIKQLFGVANPDRLPPTPLAWPIDGHEAIATGCGYGLWETDIGVSPVLLFLLILAVGYGLTTGRPGLARVWKKDRLLLLTGLILIWVTLELTLAKGYLNAWLTQLPVLQSLHVTTRYTTAFILPLTMLGLHALAQRYEKWDMKVQKKKVLTLSCVGVFLYLFYIPLPSWYAHDTGVGYRGFWNVEGIIRDWHETRNNLHDFKIESVKKNQDTDVFHERASSMYTYEALFNYATGYFVPRYIQEGSVYKIKNNH